MTLYNILTKKACIATGFFCIFFYTVFGQQQTQFDSLALIYKHGKLNIEEKLKALDKLAEGYTDPKNKLAYSKLLIQEAKAVDSVRYLFLGFLEQGNAFRNQSNLTNALESYFEGTRLALKDYEMGALYLNIADVYSRADNYNNAVTYYQKSISILKVQKDEDSTVNLASALLNAGDMYLKFGKLDSALVYTSEAQALFKKVNSEIGLAYSLGNTGMIYAKLGNVLLAETNLNKAISLLQDMNEFYPICVYLTSISDIYHEKRNDPAAINYAFKSLELAKKYELKEQIRDANLKLSVLYEEVADIPRSLSYYKQYISYRDSVKNIESVEQMADMRTNFEVSRKQVEVDLLSQQKRNQQIIAIATAIALALIALLAIVLHRRNRFMKKTNRIIEAERKRSDNLLLNILPEETAYELKQSGKVRPQKFESVTVLFTDFKGFTSYAENLSPEKVVASVDFYFSKFDEIIEKFGLEKIKTVGDSYMCAGGLPFHTNDHALKMVQAAFEIAAFVNESKNLSPEGEIPLDVRIGINTGPVVAGVVGFKKFAYDIWGDTVNIASRMESASKPGKINVSQNTYELIKEVFDCEYRGEIDVKNRGMMKMYFVQNARKETF